METLDLEKIHRSQLLRHVVANRLTLPMTVLQKLSEGKAVAPDLLKQALLDLEAIIQFVDDGKEPEV